MSIDGDSPVHAQHCVPGSCSPTEAPGVRCAALSVDDPGHRA